MKNGEQQGGGWLRGGFTDRTTGDGVQGEV